MKAMMPMMMTFVMILMVIFRVGLYISCISRSSFLPACAVLAAR